MADLLHPPAHRGPLIAAGALTLGVGVATLLQRYEPAAGIVLAVTGALAVVLLYLGLQGAEPGPPPAHVSVVLVTGLAALGGALISLPDVLGSDEISSGAFTGLALLMAGAAALVSRRRSSAIAALVAALSAGAAVLAAWDWIFSPDEVITPYRWLLLGLAIAYGLASLALRGTSLRHAEQMVNAAGIAIFAIPVSDAGLFLFGAVRLPGFFEGVVLVGGLSLVAYATADKAPGAAYLGVANLIAFVLLAGPGRDGLLVWPLLLLVLGAVALLAGLRPARPLPPEPDSSTRPDDLPLTVRVNRD